MPVTVKGEEYFSIGEVADLVDRHRSTLWRWKQQGKIPEGLRYCDQMLLFTRAEVEDIYAYAHRLLPDDARAAFKHQLSLFTQSQP
jgi:hypothetical protein